ncbi:MAG TPA: hypothetical protein VK192_10670 [Sphingomicrobium sp.]|nr:hypothetical protein [Sphingomicrobium sp.]
MIGRTAFVAALAVSIGAPVEAKSTGCADHWKVDLNGESFAHNGAGRAFSDTELATFRRKIEAELKSAIGTGCRQGRVKVSEAKKIKRVEVSSASGASEPTIYLRSPGNLAFEWVFAEEHLEVPSAKDILDGAACWTNPRSSACLESGD